MPSLGKRVLWGAGVTVVLLSLTTGEAGAAPRAVTTLAGTGSAGATGDGGSAIHAELDSPQGVAVDGAGDVAIADTGNCRVRMIAARAGRHFGISMKAKHIYTVAGTGCRRSDSPTRPRGAIGDPVGVAFDASGDLLISDASGNRVLELPASSGRAFGLAVRADRLTTVMSRLDDPEGIAVDGTGDLYIADTAACRVDEVPDAEVTRDGVVLGAGHLSTVAGTGVCGYGGDGGPATRAELWSPSAVTVDGQGDLLIADEGNSAVREVPATTGTFYGVAIAAGDIATVAGQDTFSAYLADGLSATGVVADVNYPSGVAVDAAGDLFIADGYERCLREVPAHTGTLFARSVKADDMYTLAGLSTSGGSGPAGDASRWIVTKVTYPDDVAVGPGGTVYFSDQGADTVRRLMP